MQKLFAVMSLVALAFTPLSGAYAATATLPDFDEAEFSDPTDIDNPWLSLPVGTKLTYEGETDEGTETVEIEITGATKKVMGITTLVYRDRVYVDNELVEDTRDYLAQDDDGNIWYLGEDVDNYEDGKIADHDGSWLAGKEGAEPGYWLPADPKVGDSYYQEFLEGEAEDEAEVVSLSSKVTVPTGTYTNCLKTKDTTALEPGIVEYKYYCKQVAAQVLEEKPEDGERVELIKVERESSEDVEGEDSVEMSELRERLIDLLRQLIARLTAGQSFTGINLQFDDDDSNDDEDNDDDEEDDD